MLRPGAGRGILLWGKVLEPKVRSYLCSRTPAPPPLQLCNLPEFGEKYLSKNRKDTKEIIMLPLIFIFAIRLDAPAISAIKRNVNKKSKAFLYDKKIMYLIFEIS